MKTLIFSSLALVGLLLVGWQHRQLGQLRAENAGLEQSSAEAAQLKADLAKSSGNEAQDEAEIARLREENRDLLKLRNEINQLRDTRGQFEKASAENQRLRLVAASAPGPDSKQTSKQPTQIRIENLSNQGQRTPEAAVQTFLWAEREGNIEMLIRCATPQHQTGIRSAFNNSRQDFENLVSVEIAARRELDANTVQLGIQIRSTQWNRKVVVTLKLSDGEWRLDVDSL